MEKDFLKVIETRRSCRKYKPEQITDEELKAVLEAGTYAPTSRGMQSPYIVAVQKKEVLAQLAKMNAEIMELPQILITMRPPTCWFLRLHWPTIRYRTEVACWKT